MEKDSMNIEENAIFSGPEEIDVSHQESSEEKVLSEKKLKEGKADKKQKRKPAPSKGSQTKKKGMKLTAKIIVAVAAVMVLVCVVSGLFATITLKNTATDLVKNQLNSAAYATVTHYSGLSEGTFKVTEDGLLYKGSYSLVDKISFINDIAADSGIYSMIFFEGKAYISSITDENGTMFLDAEVPEDVSKKVYEGETVYVQGAEVNNEKYYAVYAPFYQAKSADVCGILFCGISSDVVSDEIQTAVAAIGSSGIVVIIIGIVIVVIMLRIVTGALTKAVDDADSVSQGRLDFEVSENLLGRSDEIGDMARSINTVITNFRDVITKITNAVSNLNSFTGSFSDSFNKISETISNVNVAVDEIAHGATEQASETMAANDKVINIGDAIGDAGTNVTNLGESSKKMKNYSDEASGTLEELAKISEKTKSAVNEVQNQTNLTNQSALAIQEATSLIADIANQTNLLSLNASIEAARAGENGRGFAVVANEIRNLADQSKASAEKIAEIVNNLIMNSNESVETMDEVMGVIGLQNKKLDDTRSMFGSLNAEISTVNNAIKNIETEMAQLLSIKDAVYVSVENLAAIAEENAASTEETSASMTSLTGIVDECLVATEQLVQLAVELDESVRVFKL
ncbi:MAG: cache domain-containing protein [Lachnospiraceae bacterium]|nr:cache domain-containing protein [Lachnospiraceae bacterium]